MVGEEIGVGDERREKPHGEEAEDEGLQADEAFACAKTR